MVPRGPPAAKHLPLVLLFLAAAVQLAASQLSDSPLELPGRLPRGPPPGSASAAAAPNDPEERYGYFSIPGTQRRLFYWFFEVGGRVNVCVCWLSEA